MGRGVGEWVKEKHVLEIFQRGTIKRIQPWLVWLSGLSASLRTKELLV